jgi:ELWxxDGT repeat protein
LAVFVFNAEGEMTRRLDLHPTVESQGVLLFREYKGEAYFEATGADGPEIYKTDGNTLTQFDVIPDNFPLGGVAMWGSTEFNGELYFVAPTRDGVELVKTDGTQFTTFDINPGSGDSYPSDLQVIGDELVFKARGPSEDAIYGTDGQTIRKLLALKENTYEDYPARLSSITDFARLGDQLFFLGKTDAGFRLFVVGTVPEPSTICLLSAVASFASVRMRKRRI